MAERMGFEPMCLLGKRFSRPPRYDRFDTSPCLIPDYSIIRAQECQHLIVKYFYFYKDIFLLLKWLKKGYNERKRLTFMRIFW